MEEDQVTEEAEETEADAEEDSSEEESADEAEETEADEAGNEETEEDVQLLKEQNRIIQEKLDRKEAELSRLKKRETKRPEASSETAPDLDLIRLEARGYTKKEEQDAILQAAKSLGVSPIEAAEDEFVLAKIDRMRKAHRAAAAADRPSNGSPVTKRDANYYIRKGELPKDPAMLAKVQEELARQAGGGYIRK